MPRPMSPERRQKEFLKIVKQFGRTYPEGDIYRVETEVLDHPITGSVIGVGVKAEMKDGRIVSAASVVSKKDARHFSYPYGVKKALRRVFQGGWTPKKYNGKPMNMDRNRLVALVAYPQYFTKAER